MAATVAVVGAGVDKTDGVRSATLRAAGAAGAGGTLGASVDGEGGAVGARGIWASVSSTTTEIVGDGSSGAGSATARHSQTAAPT